MGGSVTDWVVEHLNPEGGLKIVDRTPEDFLIVQFEGKATFPVAVIGARDVVLPDHVRPVLSNARKPEFVVNIPSKTMWSGPAIDMVHATPAAFGTLGDLQKAARDGDVPGYRNKNFDFFESSIGQHKNVRGLVRLYDHVFMARRWHGDDLTIALVDAYNLSAEDVRNARKRYGQFDIAVKMTSYGSITSAADRAAESMGAEALMFGDLMRRLGR